MNTPNCQWCGAQNPLIPREKSMTCLTALLILIGIPGAYIGACSLATYRSADALGQMIAASFGSIAGGIGVLVILLWVFEFWRRKSK